MTTIKNGIVIDGKIYELVKSGDKTDDCRQCDLRKECEICAVKTPCMSFKNYVGKHFKLKEDGEH